MNYCIVILYSSFLQCYMATADLKICEYETPYRSIYTLSPCLMSQDVQKILENMSPVKTCESREK